MPKFAEKAMKVDVVKTGQQLRGADLYYRFCRFSKLINKDKKKKEVEKSSKSIRSGKSLAHVKMSKTSGLLGKKGSVLGKELYFSFAFLAHLTRKHANLFGSNFSSFYCGVRTSLGLYTPTPPFYSKCICPLL